MEDKNSGGLGGVVNALAEKQPNSIKEIGKFLADLMGKLDAFSIEVKAEIGKVASSSTEIHAELGSIRESMGFMNEHFECFKADIEAFRQ